MRCGGAGFPGSWGCLLVSVLCSAAPAVVHGQERYGMLVLELPASARAMALGDAFPLGSPDADALPYGPAFSGSLRGFSAGAAWWSSEAIGLSVSAGGEWWDGAIGASLQTLEYESAAVGYIDPFAAESALGSEGPVRVSERAASLGYAREVWELDASVTGKLLEMRAAGERDLGYAIDVAIGRTVGPVRLALAGRNLGPHLDAGGAELTLPARVALGASTARSVPLGALDLGASASVGVREDGELVGGGGIEVSYWPVVGRTFFARLGVQRADAARTPWTLGAGFSGDRIGLDWAWAPYDDGVVGGAHRLSVRLR